MRERRIQAPGVVYCAVGNRQLGDVAAGIIINPMGGFVFCEFTGFNSPMLKWALRKAKASGVSLLISESDGKMDWVRRQLFAEYPNEAKLIREEAKRMLGVNPEDPWLKSFLRKQELLKTGNLV